MIVYLWQGEKSSRSQVFSSFFSPPPQFFFFLPNSFIPSFWANFATFCFRAASLILCGRGEALLQKELCKSDERFPLPVQKTKDITFEAHLGSIKQGNT